MITIWILSDGKPGHLNQSLGLCDALQRQRDDIQVETRPALPGRQAFTAWLLGRWPETIETKPDIVIGAGHRTHLSILAAGRAFKASTVVLMKPSLPAGWFDLCLIPEHDKPGSGRHILPTRGALNRMRPVDKKPDSGMLLIGGPSKHHSWDNGRMVAQVLNICRQSNVHWTLTTSRRTPADFLPLLSAQHQANLTLVPVEDTDPGWLASQLPAAKYCWVSADSVSMVYEALTAGCHTGLLEVTRISDNRVSQGLDTLAEQHIVSRYSDWPPGYELPAPPEPFEEASRCARELRHRLAVLQQS